MISSQLGTDGRRPRLDARRGAGWSASVAGEASGSSASLPSSTGAAAADGADDCGARRSLARLGGDPVGVSGSAQQRRRGGEVLGVLVLDGRGGRLGDQPDRVLAQRQLDVVVADRGQPAGTGRRPRPLLRGLVAHQPAGLVVVGDHVAARGVVDELGAAGALTGPVVGHQRPATVVSPPGVPLDGRGVHVTTVQALGDRIRQHLGRPLAGLAAHRGALGGLRDVRALGQHRRGVAHHPVQGGLRIGGDVLGRLSGADACLDVAGAEGAVHGDLQLAESGVIAAKGGPESGVGREVELLARVTDQHQRLLVLGQPHEREVLHLHGGRPLLHPVCA